jgi:monothiol glutaredoxin
LASQIQWTLEDVKDTVKSSRVVVFAKGSAAEPKCGFSKRAISVVERCGTPYEVVDVSESRSMRAALAAFSGERALPLVFVDGQLVPTSDYLDGVGAGEEIVARVSRR